MFGDWMIWLVKVTYRPAYGGWRPLAYCIFLCAPAQMPLKGGFVTPYEKQAIATCGGLRRCCGALYRVRTCDLSLRRRTL